MFERLLVLSAHPDDLELGMAGIVQRAAAIGMAVAAVIMTLETETRRSEGVAALEYLGVDRTSIHLLEQPDGDLADSFAMRSLLFDHLGAGAEGSIVAAPSRHDSHPDHRVTNSLARSVFRRSPLFEYPVARSVELPYFTPTHHAPLSDLEAKQKESAIELHASQRMRDAAVVQRQFEAELGACVGVDRAEALAVSWHPGHRPDEAVLDALGLRKAVPAQLPWTDPDGRA